MSGTFVAEILKHPLALFIRQLGLHSPLSSAARNAILDLPVQLKTREAGAYLMREGDAPTQCTVLVSGYAYRQKQTGDGLRQFVSLHIPGDPLDLQQLALDAADHSVRMMTGGQLAFVSHTHIRGLMRSDPEVADALFRTVLIEGSIFREWVLNVSRRDAPTRLAHLLCEFALRIEKFGLAGDDQLELPMTQEQLADAVGLTPVHVNRTLKRLEATGLVSRNRGRIVFPSWQRMRDVADFSQNYLHLEKSAPAS
jgi:CRP-like cAMP-binding protein